MGGDTMEDAENLLVDWQLEDGELVVAIGLAECWCGCRTMVFNPHLECLACGKKVVYH